MMGLDLETKIGPLRLRAWGLIANFFANLVMLYGLSQILAHQTGWFLTAAGAIMTVILIWTLAKPSV